MKPPHMPERVKPPVLPALKNALRLRCPRCRKGAIFANWLNKVLPQCPVCGLPYHREPGYYLGGMIVTYVFTSFTLLAAYLFSLLLPELAFLSENDKLAVWIAAAIVATMLFVRPSYSLWLSADFWITPWEPQPGKAGPSPGLRSERKLS
jgi:uncharacterized protein (DUF983 family)